MNSFGSPFSCPMNRERKEGWYAGYGTTQLRILPADPAGRERGPWNALTASSCEALERYNLVTQDDFFVDPKKRIRRGDRQRIQASYSRRGSFRRIFRSNNGSHARREKAAESEVENMTSARGALMHQRLRATYIPGARQKAGRHQNDYQRICPMHTERNATDTAAHYYRGLRHWPTKEPPRGFPEHARSDRRRGRLYWCSGLNSKLPPPNIVSESLRKRYFACEHKWRDCARKRYNLACCTFITSIRRTSPHHAKGC